MSGLNFSLGGKLDPSFKASLNQAVRESEAASLRIQSSLRKQIGGLDRQIASAAPGSAEAVVATEKRDRLSRALLIAQNGQFLAAAKQRIAAQAATAAAEQQVGNAVVKTVGHVGGLNLMLRETLVVFREIGRGNWSRVPGSVSLIVQGFAQMKQLSLLTLGIWAGAIGGIVGSFFLYMHRVKSLAAELATTIQSAFKPEHIASYQSKLEIINQLHKDVADSARQIQEAHDSVGDSIQRELDLTRDRISFERELLEAQKANALAAVKNPAEREAIEKKYSALILAKKKEERDAELKAMKDEAKALPDEIAAKEAEIKRLTEGDFVTKGRDEQILKKRQSDAAAYDDYNRQLMSGEKDERKLSADKDRKTIADLLHKKEFGAVAGPFSFTEANKAELKAAQDRLGNADAAQKSLNAWIDAGDARERSRQRVDELKKKVQEDSDRLTKLGPDGKGAIADTARKNLQKDQEDLALEQERLKRVDAGRPLSGREVTERERVGFGSPQIALLDVNRSMDRKLGILVQHAQQKQAGAGGSFGTGVPAGHGD